MKRSYLTLGLLIVFVSIIEVMFYFKWSNNSVSFVTLSINPEIELALDNKDIVIDVIALNKDADILTSDLNLKGLTIEDASKKIIDSSMEMGYLDEYSDENTVVVTVVNDSETKRQVLEEKVMTKLNEHFEMKKIYPIVIAKGLDEDLKREADEYGISYGKMLLIEKAVTLNEILSKESLINISIRDIQSEIKDAVAKRLGDLNELEQKRNEWKEEKNNLKQERTEIMKQEREKIIEKYQEEFKNMTQEQKREAIETYLTKEKEEMKSDIRAIREEMKKGNEEYLVIESDVKAIREQIKGRIQEKRAGR